MFTVKETDPEDCKSFLARVMFKALFAIMMALVLKNFLKWLAICSNKPTLIAVIMINVVISQHL